MPKRRDARRHHDFALLEQRYLKLLKIAALPTEEEKRQAIEALLDEAHTASNTTKEAPLPKDDATADRGSEMPLDELFTDVTSQREGMGYILPGEPLPASFPKRSPQELKQLIGTFLDLLIAEKKGESN